MADLQAQIEELWERRGELSPADTDAAKLVEEAIDLLDKGEARVAEVDAATDEVVVHEWLKKSILLLFSLRGISLSKSWLFKSWLFRSCRKSCSSACAASVPLSSD